MARLEAEVERLREAHRAALNTAHAEVDRLRRALYEIVNITVASQMAAEALHG